MRNSNLPKVSIVTPSYNQGEFLEETILSVLNQDYPNIEYIIIDGGSTDGSVDIIRKYADRLAYWVSEPDAGQAHALNKGFARGNGSILGWLNSDDLYQPGAITAAVSFLLGHPEVSMVYGDCLLVDHEGRALRRFRAREYDQRVMLRGVNLVPQPAAFFRREAFYSVGCLNPKLHYALDYDLWIRLGRSYKLQHISATLAKFRVHGGSKSVAQIDRMWAEVVHVHRLHGGSKVSRVYAKYLLRRALRPLLPLKRRVEVFLSG